MGRIVFVTGGARSGKSAFAEQRASETGAPVAYYATMQAGDPELSMRVERHRARRPAGWKTVEAPVVIVEFLEAEDDRATVLLDCLSLWVSNVLFASGHDDRSAAEWERFVATTVAAAEHLVAVARRRSGMLIAVSNEVGSGIVPAEPMTRYYRDALGLVNQQFARDADEAFLLVSGIPVSLK